MYKLWMINFGWFASGDWPTLRLAINAAKKNGYDVSIQKYVDGRYVAVGSWSILNGLSLDRGACPDGELPDGPTCPSCGRPRGPSGVDRGTWVHLR